MTEKEKKIFWKLDDELYLVEKNNTYKMFSSFIKFNNDVIQSFIDKLMSWYFIKYNDKYIELLLNSEQEKNKFHLIETMSFEKFKERNLMMTLLDDNKDNLYYQYLIVMAGWGIIHNRNSNPEYGLFRVKEMFNDFNSFYDWNLDYRIYESIIKFDYSLTNPIILNLLKQRKMDDEEVKLNNKKKNKLSKIKSLFRR